MTQVLVKTTPMMQGHHSYDVEPEAVRAFTSRPDVWWYLVPAEDDSWNWHRGGAWSALAPEPDAAGAEAPLTRGPGPDQVPRDEVPRFTAEDDEDDDRWLS